MDGEAHGLKIPSPGSQTDCGFKSNNGISLGRIDDTTIRLRAQRESNGIRRNTNSTPRATTARVKCEVVRASALTPSSREPFRVVVAAHIGPLTQSGLAEQDGAGFAKALHHVSVTGDDAA